MNQRKIALSIQENGNAGSVQLVNKELIKQNTRTLLRALLNCRKNCAECQEDEEDYEKPLIHCFYNRSTSPCPFTTSESKLMEKHYRQKHSAKAQEASRE